MSRKLAAFAGLGTLRHLYLQIARACEVVDGNAEAPRRNLLHGAVARIAVGVGRVPMPVFAAFAGVAARADAVHRNRHRFVRLAAYGSQRYCAGGEALYDFARRLYLIQRNGRVRRLELKQAPDCAELAAEIVGVVGELLVGVEAVGSGGVLKPGDSVRVPHMIFAVAPPLIEAARLKVETAGRRKFVVGGGVALSAFLLDFVYADAAYARWRPSEVGVNELGVQPHRLEYLSAAVAADGGYAHLGHYLEDALVRRLDIVLFGGCVIHGGSQRAAVGDHIRDSIERQIRIDRARAVAQQQRHMRHFARLARFHHKPDFGADALPYEVVMHARHRKQAWDGDVVGAHAPVRQDDDGIAVFHGARRLFAHGLQRALEGAVVFVAREERAYRLSLQARHIDGADLFQFGVGQHRTLDPQHAAVFGRFGEQVHLGTDCGFQGCNQFLADSVQRRVADLREKLLEVVEQQRALFGQHRQRSVVAHRAYGFAAGLRHRLHNQAQVFARVAERDLLRRQIARIERRRIGGRRQIVKYYAVLREPFAVGLPCRQIALQLGVIHKPPLLGVQ